MFDQYLELGGTEIANAARVAAYVRNNNPSIPIPAKAIAKLGDSNLHLALGEAPYQSPTVDNAPWLDPSNPATAQFFGVWPLAVQNIDSSTLQADTTESIGDGGTTGAQRMASRAIRVRALLVGENDLALDAGNTWLTSALKASECTDHGGSCGGAKLCYYAARPEICDAWAPTYEAPFSFSLPIGVDVAGSPAIIREPNSDGIFKAQLDGPTFPPTSRADGAVMRWGTVSRDDTTLELESYGPIVRQRTNLFVRPDFLSDDVEDFWSGAFTVESGVDGPSGRAYAHISGSGGSGYGSGEYGGGEYGGSGVAVLEQDPAQHVVAPAGPLIIMVDLRAETEATVTVQLRNPDDNTLLTSATFLVTDQWNRYSFPLATSPNFYLAFTSTGAYDITGIDVEAGNIEFPYLDGGQPWQVVAGTYTVPGTLDPQYTVNWVGQPHKSFSRLRWLGQMTVGMPFGETFSSYGGGTCDVWPFIDVIQGEISGGRADFQVRPKILPEAQALPYERTMHDVTTIEGPIEIERVPLKLAGAMRVVEFTMVAGKPSAYSTTEVLVEPTKMSELPTEPWSGIEDCTVEEPTPIIDPDCVVPPAPPRPPQVPAACIVDEPDLFRYWLAVPAASISLWQDMVPRMTIQSGVQAIRQVRVRVFPNPFDREVGGVGYDLPVDPCSWCSEFIVSYLPPQTELTVDAILERAFASVAGGPAQPADTLLYASDGGPMTWPALSCGISYIFAVDVPEPLLDDVTIALELARKV